MENETGRQRGQISRRAFLGGLSGLAALSALRLPLPPAEALPQFEPFSFIFVCDSHLVNGLPDTGEKLLKESQLFLQEVIKNFNVLKPDFVLFGGDMVETVGKDETNWLLFGELAQRLEVPWSFVLGERDVSGKIPPDKMRTFGGDWRGRGLENTTPYWSLNPVAGVHLIGLDTSVPNSDSGNVSEEQLAWLKTDLAANKNKFTIVFAHHPLLPPAPYDGGPPWSDYTVPNGADVREILGGSPDVRMVVSGHLYMNKIQIERDVWHISCAGLDVYPCQYKLIRVSRNGIVVESFAIPFPGLVKLARKALIDSNLAFKYDSKDRESFVRLCEGERVDQDALLSLQGGKAPQPLSKKDKQTLESGGKNAKVDEKSKGKDKGKSKEKDKDKDTSKKSKGKEAGKEKDGSKDKKSKETDKPGKDSGKESEKKSKDDSPAQDAQTGAPEPPSDKDSVIKDAPATEQPESKVDKPSGGTADADKGTSEVKPDNSAGKSTDSSSETTGKQVDKVKSKK